MNQIDKSINNLAKRVAAIENGNGNGNGHEEEVIIKHDEYYISLGIGGLQAEEPPRFLYYNYIREKKLGLENLDQKARPTLDELEFFLKRNLAEPPELRYQRRKKSFLFHDTSCYMRKLGEEDYGCTGAGCIPECRFYNKYGRFEDEEVIAEHNAIVEDYRSQNRIIEIARPTNEELKEFLREFYNNDIR